MGFFRAAVGALFPQAAPLFSAVRGIRQTVRPALSGGAVPVSGGSRTGTGTGDELPASWRDFGVSLIEEVLDGASDRYIRSRWAKRPSGMKFEHLERVVRMGNADALQNIALMNELEKVLGKRKRRSVIPKSVRRFLKQASAINKLVHAASMFRTKGKRR